jgi:hypothetical protein
MKRHLFTGFLCLALMSQMYGQDKHNHVNFGLYGTNWGVGVMASANFSIVENITVGPLVSLAFDVDPVGFSGYRYTHTIFGIGGKVDYYLNDVINLPSEFDVYAGGNAGYFLVATSSNFDSDQHHLYRSSRSNNVFVQAEAGGRYYFKDNLAVFAEVSVGWPSNGARAGLSIRL